MKASDLIVISISAMSLAACGSASNATGEETSSAASPEATKPATSMVQLGSLSGPWCHRTTLAGDEQSDENRNYLFNGDGTLLYQVSTMNSRIDGQGSYSIDGDAIKIKPTLTMFNFKIRSFDENAMVIGNSMATLHWTRGACS